MIEETTPGPFDHLRIEANDEFDLVQSVTLRACPGGVLLLDIETVYKHPTIEDARDGVALMFGPNVAYVTIPNLPQRYRVYAEPTRYGASLVYVPYSFTRLPVTLEQVMAMEEVEVQPETREDG